MILKTTLLPLLVLLSLRAGECATGPVNFVVSTNEDVAKPYIREKRDAEDKPPIITEMNINSNVSNRFATTLIESKVKNAHTKAREATFSVILPEQAFISEFVMIIDGKSYKAYVKEKEEAKNIYDKAVSSGQSAAHVAVSARDSNRFTVSVNVEPEAKATFLLTYEELLERKNEQYELVLNINPGQIVKNLNVRVNVNESRPLTFVKTPALRSGNEISKKDDKLTPLSTIERISPTNTIVKFKPTIEQQKEYAKELGGKDDEGFSGQFVVQYEVERDPSGGEILLKDGYFVHFFAPKDTESLPKNVYFILDTSSSMFGTKIQQLKDAMMSILQEIKPVDTLSIVEFNSGTFAWNIEAEKSVEVNFSNYTQPFEELSKNDLPGPVEATKDIIEKAKKLVSNMRAIGGTYMIGGLETGLYMVKSEIDRAKGTTNKRQPMIVFLTDGQPNIGTYSTEEITKHVTRLNSEGIEVPIFSLSFGQGADKAFLRRLSLKNSGFARHIYEASDASIQLQDFYKIISSPLLTDIHFKYDEEAKEITKIRHPIYFKGNEIAIAGRYTGPKLDVIVDAVGPKGPVVLKPTIEEPVTSLERLWAYLTIKQTLEKREVAENKTELTKKALDLALKYSFVTDVSSLVVVKPNATDDVNTEDASNNNPSPNFGFHNKLAYSPMANFRPAVQPLSVGDSGGPILIRGSDDTAKLGSAAFDSPVAFASAFVPPTTNRIPAYTTLTEKPSTSPSISELEKSLHWLSAALNANGTLLLPGGAFELGDSSLNLPVDGTCLTTPKGEEGNCTLLKDCPAVFSLLTDFEVYKKFSCVVQNKYAGVCCPKAVPVPL